MYGPNHFIHHTGSGYKGKGPLYQLDNGCIVAGLNDEVGKLLYHFYRQF